MMRFSMQTEQRDRLLQLLRGIAMILLIGMLYYGFTVWTGIRIPCVIYQTTGWYCAGCGLTRFCTALLRCDIRAAADANLLLLFLMPLLLGMGIYKAIQFVRTGGTPIARAEKYFWLVILITALLFGILRNLPMFSYLQPK